MPGYKTLATSALAAGALFAAPVLGTDCTCKDGAPKTGAACNGDNGSWEKCETCNPGFFRNSGNSCDRCPLKAGVRQIPDGLDACKTCPADEEPNAVGDACIKIACTCPNGTPEDAGAVCKGKIGAGTSRQYCKSCDLGYKKSADGTKCELVTCECLHGTPIAGGAVCATKINAASPASKSFCASCNPTYELNAAKTECVQKDAPSYSCYCDKGTPVSGAMCWEQGHAAHVCETCEANYGIGGWPDKDGKCILQTGDTCTCTGGTSAKGDWCTHNGGGEVCVECKPPLILTWDGKCKPEREVQCTCDSGFPVDTKSCLTRGGGEACDRCGGNFGDLTKAQNGDGTHQPFVGGKCVKQETPVNQFEVVDLAFAIPNMDYVMLKEEKTGLLLEKVQTAIKDAILEIIGNEWKRDSIQVTMAAGSTIVNARLTMPTNTAAKNLAALLKQHQFKVALATKLNALGLGHIMNGETDAQVGTVGVKFAPGTPQPVQQPPAKHLPVQQPPPKQLPVQRPPVVVPQQPPIKPIPAKPLPSMESMPDNVAAANAGNAVAGALGGYEVTTPQTTSTTNFPLLGAVAAAFFAGGLFVARALPRGRGIAPVEHSLMEREVDEA